jgi:haloalkane dehalogenase
MMPERFRRLVIMNTWLHHEGYEYSPGIRSWHSQWCAGGAFDRPEPNVGLLMVLSAGFGTGKEIYPHIAAGSVPELSEAAQAMHDAYLAPFKGLPDAAYHGLRRFPLSIPLQDPFTGNAPAQALHYERLLAWDKPIQFVWGCRDPVFLESWGRSWAARLRAPFDALEDAGHFPQNTHGKALAELILQRG